MHEVAIAQNILKIASDELSKHDGNLVASIHIEVGKLSGVVVDSLLFALEASKDAEYFQQTQFTIDETKALAKCMDCSREFEADDFIAVCPDCSGFRIEYLSGKELKIKSLSIQ